LVSKDEENDSQTEITIPDEVSTLDAQPAVTEAPQTTAPVPEPVQEESKVVKEEEVQPVIVESVSSTEEAAPETVNTAEPTGEVQAPAPETELATVVDQTQETEQPKEEQPKKEQPKEEKPADEKPAEEHHERTYAEVVASNIPEERDSLNEDHPLMGDSKSTTAAAKPAQPAPEFDETSELTVEPVTSAEATSAPVAVAKEAPKEAPKEESSFFTCLSSFKFW